eukprot:CAMPEP_0172313062 /NCGR_PEP_ID=MMETSP1058-20130122/19260_1 /TAXON_ID=83371 /ORGANISM="Detonula confervacea, Strain CCMP 353" /LENGTH=396 /DNA_ID=CAMNT_0013026649 /DNA_START=19 /DNA_END=1209 /DNA_ORIENTATION=+
MTLLLQSHLATFLSLLFSVLLFGSALGFQSGFTIGGGCAARRTSRSSSRATSSFTSSITQQQIHPTFYTAAQRTQISIKMGTTTSSTTTSRSLSDSAKTQFQDKSILLTGASRGLGRSLAHKLATCEPSLLILSGRDEDALQQVKKECLLIAVTTSNCSNNESTMKVEIIVCDLADKSDVDQLSTASLQMAQQLHSTTRTIDILINNGGISSRSSFLETNLSVDERLLQVNFLSGAALAKALVPNMVHNNNGRIIWISSIQGKLGTPYRTSYAASKFAVQGYCESLRSELSSSNISVHIISPGYIKTNLSKSAVMGDGKGYGKMDETTANGADPEETAMSILNSVAGGRTDIIVAATFTAKAALWLKVFAPTFLENMLVKRFLKQQRQTVQMNKND